MSIGQPSGPALLSASEATASAVLSRDESMHEYQDNGSPGVPDFAKRFVQYHVPCDLDLIKDIEYLPIPGIKSMLGLIPLACGSQDNCISVGTTTSPGYPTPADWCKYLDVGNYALNLNRDNEFRFDVSDIHKHTDLLMLNYPHNPTAQIATIEWWEEICSNCEINGLIRNSTLFNN